MKMVLVASFDSVAKLFWFALIFLNALVLHIELEFRLKVLLFVLSLTFIGLTFLLGCLLNALDVENDKRKLFGGDGNQC
jgi:hypothetical protein